MARLRQGGRTIAPANGNLDGSGQDLYVSGTLSESNAVDARSPYSRVAFFQNESE